MIRLIASDMDGTLLQNSGVISKHTAGVIHKLQQTGVQFIVNAGREYESAKKELDAVSVKCDIICYSGACTYDHFGNPYHITPIPKRIVKKILQIFHKHYAYADISTSFGKSSIASPDVLHRYYKNEVFPARAEEGKVYFKTQADFEYMAEHVHYFQNAEDLLYSKIPIYKISTTFINPHKIKHLREEIETLSGLHISSTAQTNLEITHAKAQKGYALLQYARKKNIEPYEILAIGDSENDYSMLSLNLGCTAAMGNASQMIKNVCSCQTLSNDDDGVAFLIEDILKEQYYLRSKIC